MGCTVLFGGREEGVESWKRALRAAFDAEGVDARLFTDPTSVQADEVDYLICQSKGLIGDYSTFSSLKGILSVWAGVEWLVSNPTLPADVPVVRMVEDGMTQGMVDYTVGHAMGCLLRGDPKRWNEAKDDGDEHYRKLSSDTRAGLMGLGALGSRVAAALRSIGFQVLGWSRSGRPLEDVEVYSGNEGLDVFLASCDILILLLPLTPETENLLDARRLELLPRGASIINSARGAIIDDKALVDALDRGHLAHAVLDVFRVEPLPESHPFNQHPKITVTPHIASTTRPVTGAISIARQIRRREEGMDFERTYDRQRGY